MKWLVLINICCCLHFSCSSVGQQHFNTGLVKSNFEIFAGTVTPPFLSSSLIWYRDSTVIMEIPTVRFETQYGQPAVRKDTIMHYLYIDLKTVSFYQYGTFTDTAQLQKSYCQSDTLHIDGGWNFYSSKPNVIINKPQQLADTVIDYIHYQRIKFVTEEDQKSREYSIGYIRCDRGRSMFSKEKVYTDSINCCLVKKEYFDQNTNFKTAAISVVFIRDSLSPNEIKIFDTWEKYAKKNPPKDRKLK